MARKPTIEQPANPVTPKPRYQRPMPPKNDSKVSTPMKVGGTLPSTPTPPKPKRGSKRK